MSDNKVKALTAHDIITELDGDAKFVPLADVEKMVEEAYREGHSDGYDRDNCTSDNWKRSNTAAALRALREGRE